MTGSLRSAVAASLLLGASMMPTEGLTRSVARRRLTAAIKPKKQRPFKGSKTAKRATKRGGNQGKAHV